MSDLAEVLSAFQKATGCEAALWVQGPSANNALSPVAEPRTPGAPTLTEFPATSDSPVDVPTDRGPVLVAAVSGPHRAWLALGPCLASGVDLRTYMSFLLPVVTQYLQSALEVEHAANELAERYEEINLLY
ncbi:MAG TPA: hypothetical protein VGP95_11075, partial [Gemmatimonadaceae bacterium]|nr:hypothetical protein [Gemmatimonadaceae bacterium]